MVWLRGCAVDTGRAEFLRQVLHSVVGDLAEEVLVQLQQQWVPAGSRSGSCHAEDPSRS